jgi:hypothetical protein
VDEALSFYSHTGERGPAHAAHTLNLLALLGTKVQILTQKRSSRRAQSVNTAVKLDLFHVSDLLTQLGLATSVCGLKPPADIADLRDVERTQNELLSY